ncbi:MAG TPA: hypothetical protein VG295_12645 [Solirubrobacteraceae bacterium]|jgi:hypothetical protein|nr:hypothetical protein [Solirubrobacteraceae bacterium]
MRRRGKQPSSTGERSLEELLQADPQSLRMSGRRPITDPDGDAPDPWPQDLPQQRPEVELRRTTQPDAESLDEVAGEVMREIAALQDRVGDRLAEEAKPARGGPLRTLVARARRRG